MRGGKEGKGGGLRKLSVGMEWNGGLTLDCGVVLVDKVGLDELYRQGRLPDSSPAHDDQFVLAEELRLLDQPFPSVSHSLPSLPRPVRTFDIRCG